MRRFLEWMEDEDNKNQDLKQEMKDYLKSKFRGLDDVESEDFNFSMEAAIYWFASDYHSGQNSELYSILSTSDYNPSRLNRGGVKGEDETIQMLYDALEEKFSHK